MPPIEFGQNAAGALRPVGAVRTEPAVAPVTPTTPVAAPAPAAQATAAATAVQTSQALNAGKPPVDENRVSQIKDAIERGTYPLLPTKVADAMIAAGLMLSTRS